MDGFWQNIWVWLLFGGMIAMHLFHMRGHGSHGGGCCGPTSHDKSDENKDIVKHEHAEHR